MNVDPSKRATLSAVIEHDLGQLRRLHGRLDGLLPALDRKTCEYRDLAAIAYLLPRSHSHSKHFFPCIPRVPRAKSPLFRRLSQLFSAAQRLCGEKGFGFETFSRRGAVTRRKREERRTQSGNQELRKGAGNAIADFMSSRLNDFEERLFRPNKRKKTQKRVA